MPSPPKPWELGNSGVDTGSTAATSASPALPERPSSLGASAVNSNALTCE